MELPIYVYDYADVSFDEATALLAADASALLQDATDATERHGAEVASRLHLPFGGFDLGRGITIEVGEVEAVEELRSRVPMTWTSSVHPTLYPTLDGHLEVTAISLEPPQVQVTLVGAYTPPLGLVGAAAQPLGGRRLVDTTVHQFVRDVAARLQLRIADAASRHGTDEGPVPVTAR